MPDDPDGPWTTVLAAPALMALARLAAPFMSGGGVGGPRGSMLMTGRPDGWLLAGDETAVPAMRRFTHLMDADAVGRILVEVAMAFAEVIRADQWDRVRVCSADDCDAVYVDFSKNGSKRYCDTGNCGNRMNVNAYRRRRARQTA